MTCSSGACIYDNAVVLAVVCRKRQGTRTLAPRQRWVAGNQVNLLSSQKFCEVLREHHSFIADITVYVLSQIRSIALTKSEIA